MKPNLIISLFFILILSSCEQDVIREIESRDNESAFKSQMTEEDLFVFNQMFEDAPIYSIETIDELPSSLESVTKVVDSWLYSEGWRQDTIMPVITEEGTRAFSFQTDTVWERNCWVIIDEDVQRSMYFKAKLSSKVINAINAKIDRKYWLSTNTTYRCEWQIMGIYRDMKDNEQFAMVDSPLSGLHPDSKSDYWTRNCKLYTNVTSTGITQKSLISYRLLIISTDTDKPKDNEWYNLHWPAEILDSPYRGYQFIYRILTR